MYRGSIVTTETGEEEDVRIKIGKVKTVFNNSLKFLTCYYCTEFYHWIYFLHIFTITDL